MSGNFWTTSNKYFFELVASHFSILYKMVRSFKISIKVINEGLLHVKSIYLWCRLVRSTSVIFPVTKALLRSMILFAVALFLRQFWPVQDFLTGLWFCNLSGLFSRNGLFVKTPLFVIGQFCSRYSICLNIGFWQSSFEWKWCVFNLSGFN